MKALLPDLLLVDFYYQALEGNIPRVPVMRFGCFAGVPFPGRLFCFHMEGMKMAITDIPVGLTEAYFVDAAEDFQKGFADGAETDENRTSYDGDSYLLDIQIGTYVFERGLRAWAGQVVSLEVPVDGAVEALKKIRSLPPQTPVKFAALNVRSGISQKGKLYTSWTGKGMEVVRTSVPAQRPAQS